MLSHIYIVVLMYVQCHSPLLLVLIAIATSPFPPLAICGLDDYCTLRVASLIFTEFDNKTLLGAHI